MAKIKQVQVYIERNFRPISSDNYVFEKVGMGTTVVLSESDDPKKIRAQVTKELQKEVARYIKRNQYD